MQQQEQLGVTPLPSADEDDEKNEKEEAKTREAENDKAKEVEEGGKVEYKEPRKSRTKLWLALLSKLLKRLSRAMINTSPNKRDYKKKKNRQTKSTVNYERRWRN
jgi:hypothetical protein